MTVSLCHIFTIARVVVGNVKMGEKYEGYYYLFFIGGILTKLCLYMQAKQKPKHELCSFFRHILSVF